MKFEIEYPPTKKGKAVWNKRFGLNAYYAGKHWNERKRDTAAQRIQYPDQEFKFVMLHCNRSSIRQHSCPQYIVVTTLNQIRRNDSHWVAISMIKCIVLILSSYVYRTNRTAPKKGLPFL